jgi:isocitrate dehydrogenase
VEENFLRWDSLGEFLALAASLEHLGNTYDNPRAKVLAKTLDQATGKFLDNNKSPSRKVGGSTTAAATSTWRCTGPRPWPRRPTTLPCRRASPAGKALTENEATIVAELNAVQGKPADIGGYYAPDAELTAR